ncbi:hypothetical protein [Sphingomonas sp.]|uniref:hypothetical protein n=1 Tax=Sphingomonas sp. TaxID=28214 RepID=UPI000DB7BF1C|nr:hypothetical protein [Sphingomonas sp.]PZU07451.1 MAG: hypothetical protein DI605_15410 [Sphingomonas sp.]
MVLRATKRWAFRQRLAEAPAPPLPGVEQAPARSRENPLRLHHFGTGQMLTAEDLNRFVDALLAIEDRLAAIETRLDGLS